MTSAKVAAETEAMKANAEIAARAAGVRLDAADAQLEAAEAAADAADAAVKISEAEADAADAEVDAMESMLKAMAAALEADDAKFEAMSDENPDISTEGLNAILEILHSEIKKSKRNALIVVLENISMQKAYVTNVPPVTGVQAESKERKEAEPTEPGPVECKDLKFVTHVKSVWKSHDPKAVIPVIVTRPAPKTFFAMKLAALPWADPTRKWCPQCGARARGAADHRC
jgi:hypothetical protein